MLTRRSFLKLGAMAGTATLLPLRLMRKAWAQIPGGSLPPGDVDKFVLPLVKPPAMPGSFKSSKDQYSIGVRQFVQRILSPGSGTQALPKTTVWSYGDIRNIKHMFDGGTFNYPAFTIEANYRKTVQVTWKNELVDAKGNYLPHLLPVDQTLHWANPGGGVPGRDTRPTFTSTPGPYTGPVPIVTHVHGAHTREDSDGYPEAWFLPNAKNIPAGFARTGTFYDYFRTKYRQGWSAGSATFKYLNDQRATTLWYHDHTLGMTRLNVYAGPAGFYLIRGGPDDVVLDSRDGSTAILPGPAPGVGDDPLGTYYEIPIVVQDRSFNAPNGNGLAELFYPDTRAFFDEYGGPYIPETDVSPIWNPEFFGNMMVVNGFTWPFLDVEQRRYRFRLLNGCNSRFLILQFSDPRVEVWQIGAEGGFLPGPVRLNDYPYPGSTGGGATVLMGLAERADVIVDFTNVPVGTEVLLFNLGPDEPFGGGDVNGAFDPSDPDSTGQVMQFRVTAALDTDNTTPPQFLRLPDITPLSGGSTRKVSLNEEVSTVFDGPIAALLGTQNTSPKPLLWSDPITENPGKGRTELWKIYNHTVDAHPIHIHLVQFQVVGRQAIGGGPSIAGSNGPLPWETGFKDTVIAYPGEITKVRAKFDMPGLYVWHCHIVEHEDNEMMRPYKVG